MSFLYPLGLLGLIGIPIVIIIYILRNKYTEQTIASTYLWRLSERFLKKKKPISKISGLISLILQILIIAVISLAIAHPVITLVDSARDYCFILDGSGSMNYVEANGSRLDLGKKEIAKLIDDSADGSTYTLIHSGDGTRVVYEKLADKDKAVELLDTVIKTDVINSSNDALVVAQSYFDANKSLKTYLITDKEYELTNIELINVGSQIDNYAICDVDYVMERDGLKISGNVIAYHTSGLINIEVYIDNSLDQMLEVNAEKLVKTPFEYKSTNIDFNTIKTVIKNADGLAIDNEHIIYNIEKEHDYKALIVSYSPFYLTSMLDKMLGYNTYDVVSPDTYQANMRGYGLYVFDSFNPGVLPTDGTIWLFNLTSSLPEAGFSVQQQINLGDEGGELTYAKPSNSLAKKLLNGVLYNQIYISDYVKYGLYRNFTTLLTYDGNPVVFTGTNNNGSREVVFAFDLHNSNLPLLMDYLLLSKNLLEYSFPTIIEKGNYVSGETMSINVLAGCDSIRVESPQKNINYLDVSNEVTEFKLTEAGSYKITLMMGEEAKEFNVYVSLPEAESYDDPDVVDTLTLQGTAENNYSDGIYDKLIILFIILTVIFVADWMVYCYEQYQLR